MPNYEDTEGRWKREVERRLRTLETAPRAAHTSISDDDGNVVVELTRDGLIIYDPSTGKPILWLGPFGLTMYDGDGVGRTHIGRIGSDNYGAQVFDSGGGLRFWVDNVGYHDPWLHSAFVPDPSITMLQQRAETTSGSFVGAWEARFQLVTHGGFAADVLLGADAGTTGEARILGPDGVTAAVSFGSSGVLGSWRWQHGSPLGTGPALFKVQMRRTGGAGKVYSWWPTAPALADPLQCTPTGL